MQSVSQESLDKLLAHSWPGNVRELQSVIREALIVSTGPTLLPEFLSLDVQRDASTEDESPTDLGTASQETWQALPQFVEQGLKEKQADVYRRALQRFDLLIVTQAMNLIGGLQARAAELLGISRPTLRAMLRSLQQDRDRRALT